MLKRKVVLMGEYLSSHAYFHSLRKFKVEQVCYASDTVLVSLQLKKKKKEKKSRWFSNSEQFH